MPNPAQNQKARWVTSRTHSNTAAWYGWQENILERGHYWAASIQYMPLLLDKGTWRSWRGGFPVPSEHGVTTQREAGQEQEGGDELIRGPRSKSQTYSPKSLSSKYGKIISLWRMWVNSYKLPAWDWLCDLWIRGSPLFFKHMIWKVWIWNIFVLAKEMDNICQWKQGNVIRLFTFVKNFIRSIWMTSYQ